MSIDQMTPRGHSDEQSTGEPPTHSQAALGLTRPEHWSASLLRGEPREDSVTRIAQIRAGVPARRVGEMAIMLGMSKESLFESLGLSRTTVHRRTVKDEALSISDSELVLGLQDLMRQAQTMATDSINPSERFDAMRWLGGWMSTPIPALGGHKPASLIDTNEGQRLVSQILGMIQSGACS